jgi:beta-mannosidase
LRVRNRFFRYVSEFGFQGFPCLKTVESFTEEGDRNVHSPVMERHQRSFGGTELIITYLTRNFLYPNDFATFLYASQVLQAESVLQRPNYYLKTVWQLWGWMFCPICQKK